MRKDVRLANDLAEHVGHTLRVGSLIAQLMAVERIGGTADPTDLMAAWTESGASVSALPSGGPLRHFLTE